MTITSDQIRSEIKRVWPGSIFRKVTVVLSDTIWEPESDESLARFLDAASIHHMPFIDNVSACEEFSIALMHASRRRDLNDYQNGLIKWNRPLGIVSGTMHDGIKEPHWWNVAITETGLKIIEPQTSKVWVPDRTRDKIFFLMM